MLTLERSLLQRLDGLPRNTAYREPCGTIHPDGSFSLGSRKVQADEALDLAGDFSDWVHGPCCPVDGRGAPPSPLNLRNVCKSHKNPSCPVKPRGSKGITSLGRKTVRSFGALINRDRRFGVSTFFTATMPEMDNAELVRLVQAWSELVRQFVQWIGRRLIASGLPPVVCSVTEIQPKRQARTGQAYPHLHMLWPNRRGAKKGTYAVDVMDARRWLEKAIKRLVDVESIGHVNTNVQRVKGSVAAYMSKYMSKGGETIENARLSWGGITIKQWWNLSGKAREWVIANTDKGYKVGLLLETIVYEARVTDNKERFWWLRPVQIVYNSGLVTMGHRGAMKADLWADCKALLQSDLLSPIQGF